MLQGCIVALITPMLESGEIDYNAYEALLNWHLQAKTDAVLILGTTGESPTISDVERTKLIKIAADVLQSKKPLIVGTGINDTNRAIQYTKEAKHLGADCALVITPCYSRPEQAGLIAHYRAVAESVDMPIILYNHPGRCGVDISPETMLILAKTPNIIGIKEVHADQARISQYAQSSESINVYSGDDPSCLAALKLGAKGVFSVTANVFPDLMAEMIHAQLANDEDKAKAIHDRLTKAYSQLFIESNPIPTKWAMAHLGLIKTGIRLPLTALGRQYRAQLESTIDEIQNETIKI